jgi:ADP-ribose pyrophosphatase
MPRQIKSRDLTERTLSSEVIYDGKLLHVRRDKVRLPDGAVAEREYIRHPGAVVIIALLDTGELVMERQFRYPLARDMIELPAGKIDPGEPPLATAQRELLEETGYQASEWAHLATIHLAIGYSDEHIEIFLAKGLTQRQAKLDDEEFLEVFSLSLATALEWVRDGKITDAKTLSGLLWAEKALQGTWPPSP